MEALKKVTFEEALAAMRRGQCVRRVAWTDHGYDGDCTKRLMIVPHIGRLFEVTSNSDYDNLTSVDVEDVLADDWEIME